MLCFNIHGENSICWIVYISTIPWYIQFNYSLSCIVSMNSSGAALNLNFKSHVQCYMNLLATHRMYSVTGIYWQHIVCTVLQEFTWNQYLLATHRMYSVTGIYWQHIVCTVLQEFTWNQYLLATHRMSARFDYNRPNFEKKTCRPNVQYHMFTENDDSKFLFSLIGLISLLQHLQNTIWRTLCLLQNVTPCFVKQGCSFLCVSPSQVCNLRTRLSALFIFK